jgi:diphthamide biosynthesis protein 4
MSGPEYVPKPTHYQILQLSPKDESINLLKLKLAYRRALLLHHPDKSHRSSPKNSRSLSPTSVHAYSVDRIIEAYNTLSNATSKANYDSLLARDTSRSSTTLESKNHAGVETFDLEELVYSEARSTWSRKCRCGDDTGYLLTELDLNNESERGEIYVGCKGCSLSIRVLFDTAPTLAGDDL